MSALPPGCLSEVKQQNLLKGQVTPKPIGSFPKGSVYIARHVVNLALRLRWHIYRPQTKLAKVMFLHLSVSHSVHVGEGGLHPGGSASTQGVYIHPGGFCIQGGSESRGFYIQGRSPMGYYGMRSTSGRYAFYWNAFLT